MHENYGAALRRQFASRPRRRFAATVTCFALLVLTARISLRAQSQLAEDGVRAVLTAQQAAWNRGDVDAFMSGYEASDATTFVGAAITKGYRQVLENYRRRYPT